MMVRSRVVIASAVVTVAMTILSASASADRQQQAGKRPRGAIESCATQSGATFLHAYTSPRNLVVGPLALIGAGGSPSFVRNSAGNEGFQKFPLLVRADHRVTIELSRSTRLGAALAYGSLPQGETYLRHTHRVVSFIACSRGEPSESSADGQPVTFWSGSILARSPRCIALLLWVDSEPSPRRAVIRLGVPSCG